MAQEALDAFWVTDESAQFMRPAAHGQPEQCPAGLTPYPTYGDRFWIDDVVVKKVVAEPYDQGTVIRFDEAPPTGVRTFLAYNDTDGDQPLNLGAAAFVDLAGVRAPHRHDSRAVLRRGRAHSGSVGARKACSTAARLAGNGETMSS